jgi:hypothetical protein
MINFSFLYSIPISFVGLVAKGLILGMKQILEVFSLSRQRGTSSHSKKGQKYGREFRYLARYSEAVARASMAVRRHVLTNSLMKKDPLAKRAISRLARTLFSDLV